MKSTEPDRCELCGEALELVYGRYGWYYRCTQCGEGHNVNPDGSTRHVPPPEEDE
jgi:ssDNA-binding Zn-finger/Zn-ribbon topoisomerase 1